MHKGDVRGLVLVEMAALRLTSLFAVLFGQLLDPVYYRLGLQADWYLPLQCIGVAGPAFHVGSSGLVMHVVDLSCVALAGVLSGYSLEPTCRSCMRTPTCSSNLGILCTVAF